jgi:hypothetical protein
MFALVAKDLPTKTSYEQSAFVESFATHLRNLIDFFFDQSPQPTDVIAADFFDNPDAWRPTITPTLDEARIRANKEVSHLTLQRKGPTDPKKTWPIGVYFREVEPVVQAFVMGASQKKLSPKVDEWVNLAYRQGVITVRGAGSFSNSTSGRI